jgi:fatty-acyl-CoA synthase
MHEREVGELEIRGASVTPGYYGRPDLTEATFHNGWLRTGDLGYLVVGELVVCGRNQDLNILGGRNVYPQDIERAVADVDGVRAGNVIAFGTQGRRGREALVVVAEARDEQTHNDVRRDVVARVRDAVGIPPEEVVLVQPGTLPKTSSGKLQRTLCRDRYKAGAL